MKEVGQLLSDNTAHQLCVTTHNLTLVLLQPSPLACILPQLQVVAVFSGPNMCHNPAAV